VGKNVSVEEVLEGHQKRDATDYNRKEGPLRQGKDALLIDTTPLTIDETVDMMSPLSDLSLEAEGLAPRNAAFQKLERPKGALFIIVRSKPFLYRL